MKKIISLIIIGLLCLSTFSMLAPQVKAQKSVIFGDDFESYQVGTFPSTGGWVLIYDGQGAQYQKVIDTVSVSGVQSFQLWGQYMWSACSCRSFSTDATIIGYEVNVRVEDYGTYWLNAFISLWSDATETDYMQVSFHSDGKIYVYSYVPIWYSGKPPGPLYDLETTYEPDTWYNIRVIVNRETDIFNVWINNVLKGENLQTKDSFALNALRLGSSHAEIQVYYDDVKVFAPFQVNDITAQYSSFVSASNNYKQIFGQDVAIGQTVERTLSGVINDPPAHYRWNTWAGQTYPDPPDGFSIRIEAIQPDYVYKIIGMGYMAGSQPSASGWIQVNSPFKIEQINYAENYTYPTPWGDSYVRIYVNAATGLVNFVAKWYNWPALIDAAAFRFAITIAKPGGTLPPFSSDTTRTRASYAYDTAAKRVVMFGGRTWNTSDFRSDIWTLDPITSQWTAVSTSSEPEGRFAASMSYNPVAKNFLIFGGSTLSGPPPSGEVSDTWIFQFTDSDTIAWTQIPAMGPSARRGAPLIFDSKNALFVLFGGEQYVYSLGDTWVFDPSSSAWINKNPSPAPPQRARAAMAFDAQSGKVLLFGGLNKGAGTLLSDTWLYDGSANIWQQVVTATAPSARQFPSLACEGNGVFYLFGGWRVDAGGGLGQYLDDTWKFDMATMQWTQLLPSQSPIAQSQSALMNLGSGRFVLIGGWRDSPLGNVWIFDSTIPNWLPPVVNQPPVADFRYRGPMTSFTPSTIYVGSEVKFDAEPSYDPDGTITNYTWDFGDGSDLITTTEEVTYHTYLASGPYTITLSVTDDKGVTDQISKDIFIHPFEWALFVEIDYLTDRQPDAVALEYIENYYLSNGINLVLYVDDEVEDPTPGDLGITDNDYWAIENSWNDVRWADDRAFGDPNTAQGKMHLIEKWVLYGTVRMDSTGSVIMEYGSTLKIETPWAIPNLQKVDGVAGNYIFIPDQLIYFYFDDHRDTTTETEVETMVLMHQLGHSIGIWYGYFDLLSWSLVETPDKNQKSVMHEVENTKDYRFNSEIDEKYSKPNWKTTNLEYYATSTFEYRQADLLEKARMIDEALVLEAIDNLRHATPGTFQDGGDLGVDDDGREICGQTIFNRQTHVITVWIDTQDPNGGANDGHFWMPKDCDNDDDGDDADIIRVMVHEARHVWQNHLVTLILDEADVDMDLNGDGDKTDIDISNDWDNDDLPTWVPSYKYFDDLYLDVEDDQPFVAADSEDVNERLEQDAYDFEWSVPKTPWW